jgi:hypothetical protein
MISVLGCGTPRRYRLQKIGCGIALRPGVYASLECEIRCLQRGQIAETHRASRTTPPLMVMVFARTSFSTPGEIMKEANIRTYLYPCLVGLAVYAVGEAGEDE